MSLKLGILPIGKIWKSENNGWCYHPGGVSPTLCVGAHNGCEPKIIYIMEDNQKSVLNRYVRYIYRKMMRIHGTQKTREEALRIFALTTPERKRVKDENATSFDSAFVERIITLCNEWGIPSHFIADSLINVQGGQEDLQQILLDLTPIRVRIRKLTPLECMRLQAVKDEDTKKMMDAGLSNSALYKLAGNSICVAPLEGIFTQLLRVDSDSLW